MADNPNNQDPYGAGGYVDFDQWIQTPGAQPDMSMGNPMEMYDQLRSDLGLQNTPDLIRGSKYSPLLDKYTGTDINKLGSIKSVPPQSTYNGPDYNIDSPSPYSPTLQNLAQTISSMPQLARNDFKYVRATPFSPELHEATRYYNHPAYGRLGFDPFRDNESYYNTKGTAFEDFRRSLSYLPETIKAGWHSYGRADWDLPYLSDIKTAKEFLEATRNSQSTRPNSFGNLFLPFIGNTINQYGLTGGMLLGYLGDLAKTSITMPGIGGARGALVGATPKITRLATLKNTAVNSRKILEPVYKTMGKQESFLKATEGANNLRKIWNWTKRRGKGVVDRLTPNTVEWYRNYNTPEALGEAAKLYKGFGAFYKDYAFAHMALAESEMEAGLVQYEWERDIWDQYQREQGRVPTMEEWEKVRKMSQDAAIATAKINFPVIYFSNLLVFGKMIKPIVPAPFRPDRIIYRNAAGKVVMNPAKATAEFVEKKGIRDRITSFSLKPLYTPKAWGRGAWKMGTDFMKYTRANWVEGAQEIVQEITSDTVRDAYSAAYWADEGSPAFGALMDHVGRNTKKYISPEGFEIFMSGFAMGGISNILGAGKQAAGEQFVKYSDREKYKAYKERQKTIGQEVAKNYQDYAQNPFKYFDPEWRNYIAQQELVKEQEEAYELGDKKDIEDINDEQYQNQILTMLQAGKFDIGLRYLEDMRNLSLEEFNEAFDTEFDNDTDRFAKIDKIINEAQRIQKDFKAANEMMPNRYNPYNYNPNTEEFHTEAFMSLAHDEVIKSMVFSKAKLRRAVERYNSLLKTLQTAPIFDHISTTDMNNILDIASMDDEIMRLNKELDVIKTNQELGAVLSEEQKKDLKETTERIELMQTMKDASSKYFKLISEENTVYDEKTKEMARYSKAQIKEQEKALKELEKAFTDYIRYVSGKADATIGMPSKTDMREAFIALKDMHELKSDQKMFMDAVKYLSNPEAYKEQLERNFKSISALNEMKARSILMNSMAFTAYMEDSALATDIFEMGYFLDTMNLERVFTNGQMPTNVIGIEDGKVYTKGDPEYEKVAKEIRAFLEEVRNDGISIEEADARRKEKKAQEKQEKTEAKTAAKAEAKTKKKGKKAPKPITMDNVSEWEELDPGFFAKAMTLYDQVNKERIGNGMDAYASLEDMAKQKNSKLRRLVNDYNRTDDDISAGESDEMKFYDERTLEGNLQKLQDILKTHQDSIRPISDLTAEEREEHGVAEGEHGYIVKIGDNWVKAISVTTEMGSNFDSRPGNRVRLRDGREGTIVDKPKKTKKGWTWTIDIDDSDETVKLRTGEFQDITYEYATTAGTTVDQLGRQIFMNNDPLYSEFTVDINGVTYEIKERMSEDAFNKVKRELKKVRDQFANEGWIFIPTDVRVFKERKGKAPLAGELDLLMINNETGKIRILDFKTSKNSFTDEKFEMERTGAESGITRSKKQGYQLQQSIYANLLEHVTNAEVDGIGLIGIELDIDEEKSYVNSVKSVDLIDLERDIEADEFIEPNLDAEDLGEESFEGDYTDNAEVFDIVNKKDTIAKEALESGEKGFHLFSPLQDKMMRKISINPALKPKVFTVGSDRWYRMFPLTVDSSGNISQLASLVQTRVEDVQKRRKVLRPQFQEIMDTLQDKTLTKDVREGTVLALALGLPEEAADDYTLPIELGDRTFYTDNTNIQKFLGEQDPNKEMYLVAVEGYDRPKAGKVSKDDRERLITDMDALRGEILDAETFEDLAQAEDDLLDRMNGVRIEAGGNKKYINFATALQKELMQLIADRRAELKVTGEVTYDDIKAGHKIKLTDEFAKEKGLASTTVSVTEKKGTVIRVVDTDGNEAGISKVSFAKGRVTDIITDKNADVEEEKVPTPEEKENMKKSNQTKKDFFNDPEAIQKAKDKVKGKDPNKVINDFLNSIKKCE